MKLDSEVEADNQVPLPLPVGHSDEERDGAGCAFRNMSANLAPRDLARFQVQFAPGGKRCGKSRDMRDNFRIGLVYIVLTANDELAGTKPEGNPGRRKGKFTKSVVGAVSESLWKSWKAFGLEGLEA